MEVFEQQQAEKQQEEQNTLPETQEEEEHRKIQQLAQPEGPPPQVEPAQLVSKTALVDPDLRQIPQQEQAAHEISAHEVSAPAAAADAPLAAAESDIKAHQTFFQPTNAAEPAVHTATDSLLPLLQGEHQHTGGRHQLAGALQTPEAQPPLLQASPGHVIPLPPKTSSAASPSALPSLASGTSTPTATDAPLFSPGTTGLFSNIGSPATSSALPIIAQPASPGSPGSSKRRVKVASGPGMEASSRRSASPPKGRSGRRRPLISLAAEAAQHEFLGEDTEYAPEFHPEPRIDGGLISKVTNLPSSTSDRGT